jgi:hypothetical protein
VTADQLAARHGATISRRGPATATEHSARPVAIARATNQRVSILTGSRRLRSPTSIATGRWTSSRQTWPPVSAAC